MGEVSGRAFVDLEEPTTGDLVDTTSVTRRRDPVAAPRRDGAVAVTDPGSAVSEVFRPWLLRRLVWWGCDRPRHLGLVRPEAAEAAAPKENPGGEEAPEIARACAQGRSSNPAGAGDPAPVGAEGQGALRRRATSASGTWWKSS
jgi:hypothetical protein